MSEECAFSVEVRDFKASNLTSRNRFKDKLRLVCELDDKKFKTKKELIGGGDVQWRFSWKGEYKIFSYKYLEEKFFTITCMRSKTEVYGKLSVDLHTVVTGPEEHNLPLLDFDGKVVGRLNFIIEMPQVANVAVIFKHIKLKNLKPVGATRECNPYLKYTYSKLWPQVLEGKAKAVYSTTQYNTTDPSWADLPEIRFHAGLKELLHESIVLHVTHQGKVHNTTLGRCNLLFRTLVDNGKTFKDEDLISFRGPLKIEDAEIEGALVFKFLPKYAQMKPLNIVKKAIHTEKGVFDAVPLLPALPKPNIPIFNSESPMDHPKPTVEKVPDGGRQRAQTIGGDSRVFEDDDSDGEHEREEKKEEKKPEPERVPPEGIKKTPVSIVADDLITFTPPAGRRRAVSTSLTHSIPVNPFSSNFPQNPAVVGMAPTFGGPALPLQPFGFQPHPYAAQQGFQPQPFGAPAQQPTFNPFAAPQNTFAQPVFAAPQQQPTFQPQQQAAMAPTFNPFAPVPVSPNQNPFG